MLIQLEYACVSDYTVKEVCWKEAIEDKFCGFVHDALLTWNPALQTEKKDDTI